MTVKNIGDGVKILLSEGGRNVEIDTSVGKLKQNIETLNTKDFPQVDIITSGFPCQAFSVAGYQKGFLDPRGNYFFETLRFIQNIKPKAFLLEIYKIYLILLNRSIIK